MLPKQIHRELAATGALVAWIALAMQMSLTVSAEIASGRGYLHGLVLYFGYFTILTNALCAVIFTAYAIPCWQRLRQAWLITSAACAIVIAGAVYFLVLRHQWQLEGVRLVVDAMLHYIVPPLFVCFWWVTVPVGGIQWIDFPRTLIYPVTYLLYVFARGSLTELYPYFFVDVGRIGYLQSLCNALGLLLLFVGLSALLILSKTRRNPSPPGSLKK